MLFGVPAYTMRMRTPYFAVLLVSVVAIGQTKRNEFYAGDTNPLVKLGMERVWFGVEYPSWLLYPGIENNVRQQIVDSYSLRSVLEAMDKSSEGVQKYLDASQLILDLLSTYGGQDGSLREAPSKSLMH